MAGTPTNGEQKIIIEFPEGSGGGEGGTKEGASPNPAAPAPVDNTSKDKTKGDEKSAAAIAMGVQAAKTLGTQFVNAAVANIGLMTGNYAAQRQVQKTMNQASQIASIAMATKAGGVWGFVLAVGATAISSGFEVAAQRKENEIQNYNAAQQARRLGYSRYRQ